MTRLWPEGEPVQVWYKEGKPVEFVWQGLVHCIECVHDRWRVHTRWWESGSAAVVWREYQKVTTDTGLLCLLYQDLAAEGWSLVRVYD